MNQKADIVKMNELQEIIDSFVARQKEIRVLIHELKDRSSQNNLDMERKANTAFLRILYWMMMGMKGYNLDYKLRVDRDFPYWIKSVHGYHVNGYVINILNLSENEYWNSLSYNRYTHPVGLYHLILDRLFPKSSGGIFSFTDIDNVENTTWRDKFEQLLREEPNEYRYRLWHDVRSY